MEQYKRDFIDFLLEKNALKIGSDFKLKSGRLSPYFINIGDFNEGYSTGKLGEVYALAILDSRIDYDKLYGIPEKGIALVVATSIGLAKTKREVYAPWFFTRKIPKEYGEATNLTKEERRKKFVVGKAPNDGDKIVMLDDVFTTGDTIYEVIDTLNSLADSLKYKALFIAVDREEVGINGLSAIDEFTAKTGILVHSILNTAEIYQHLKTKENLDQRAVDRIATYLRIYGSSAAKGELGLGSLEQKIIDVDKSVIPACDVATIEEFEDIVKQTAEVDKIGGYKVGFELALGYSLARVVEAARKYTDKPIIYDHQKGGTDIPDTGKNFARVCKKAGVDAVILFPQAGPETERAWIYHALDNELNVIVGGRMTHAAYSASEGGFIKDEGAMDMYLIAARAGVNNFVVPGNKVELLQTIKEHIEAEGVKPTFYATGFIAQGGKISDAGKAAGDRWHAIVGSAIYTASDKRKVALELTSQLYISTY